MISVAFTLVTLIASGSGVSAQSWNRRAYYNEAKCGGQFAYGVQVYTPNVPCISTGVALHQVCEVKSTNPLAPSAEATGCESTTTSAVSDSVWFPSGADGSVLPNTNYMTLIKYNNLPSDQACSTSNGRINIEHETFAANGKCYAWEPNYYFKASCSGNSGSLIYCRDAACNDCNATISFTNACNVYNNLNTKMVCTGANAAAGVSSNGTSSPTPSGTSPSASRSASPSPSASGKASNDANAKVASGALMGIAGAAGLLLL